MRLLCSGLIMNELRRKDRAIAEEESIELLNKADYGVLSTVSKDGKPYGIPLNFCIIEIGRASCRERV